MRGLRALAFTHAFSLLSSLGSYCLVSQVQAKRHRYPTQADAPPTHPLKFEPAFPNVESHRFLLLFTVVVVIVVRSRGVIHGRTVKRQSVEPEV